MHFIYKIDYQQVKYKDPDAYKVWFRLVRNIINKYRICKKDIYNFDKTGFLIGQIFSKMVVIAAEQRSRPHTTQQSNRE